MANYAIGNPYVILRPDCHHHFDANGTSNAMFDELAERPLMSPYPRSQRSSRSPAARSVRASSASWSAGDLWLRQLSLLSAPIQSRCHLFLQSQNLTLGI